MSELHRVAIAVNGVRHERHVEARRLLVDFVREDLGLAGTHIGCEHGVCGTCSVLMDGQSIRSCLMLAVQADGHELLTVEGLATAGHLHPLQEAFWDQQGLQCGYCTPAMLLGAKELLDKNPNPSREQVREAIASYLCRCTGYQFIVDAILHAAKAMQVDAPEPVATGGEE